MTSGTQLTIPPFYCPIPPAASRPDADAVERRALRWITEMGAYTSQRRLDALAAARFGSAIPQAMPDALPERIQVVADFAYWGVTFDDGHFDEGRYGTRPDEAIELLGTMARIVEAPAARLLPGNPWAEALRDLRCRVDRFATFEQSRRWITGIQSFFSGLAWEIRYRRADVCPELDTYLMIRRGSIGAEPLTSMTDVADGYVLPAEAYHHPVVRALTEMTWTLVVCDNDLYSYNRESVRSPSRLNVITCLAHQNSVSPETSLSEAVALRDRIMCLFLTLRDQAMHGAGEEQRRYLTSLGRWVRANTDWALGNPRYSTGSDVPTPGYTDRPTDTSSDAPPLPSISWWWGLVDDSGSARGHRGHRSGELHIGTSPAVVT